MKHRNIHEQLEQLEHLAKQVNPEFSPPVDVTASVLQTLRSQVIVKQKREPVDYAMLCFTVASVAAACIALFYSFDSMMLINHPAMEIVQSETLFP